MWWRWRPPLIIDIIVNFEPIYKDSWRDMNPNYLELLKRQCVYDYCEINLPYLEESYFFKMPPLYSDLKPKRKKQPKKKVKKAVFPLERKKLRLKM